LTGFEVCVGAGGGLVEVGGTEVLVAPAVGGTGVRVAVGGPGVAVRVAVGNAGLAVPGKAVVGVGPGEVALAAIAVVGDGPTSVRRMTSVLPKVGDGPKVGVRVGEGAAVGGKGLSPGAGVRVAAEGDVGKTRPNPSEVGVPAEFPSKTIASTSGSFTGVPLAVSV